MDLQPDWHGRIYVRDGNDTANLIAASRPLESTNDDMGVETQRRLRPNDVLVVLWEESPPRAALARWNRTHPVARLPLRVSTLNGPFEGQVAPAASIRSFRREGRYFQLLVFYGSAHPSLTAANRALAGLRIAPLAPDVRARLRAAAERLPLNVVRGAPAAGFRRVVTLPGFGDFLWHCSANRIQTAFLASPGPPAHVHAQLSTHRGDTIVRAGQSVIAEGAVRWRVTRGRKAIVQISRAEAKGCTPWVDAYVRPG